jgi:phage terminase large subunit
MAKLVIERQIPRAFQGLYRPARYKVFHGGRGSGKSHSVADYLISMGVKRRMRFLCAREIQKSLATSVHQLLQDKIKEQGLEHAYSVTKDGIRGPNGTHFLFAGLRSNPDSVKSMEDLDGAWIEEADRCSQASLDLLTPTIRKPGSELIFTFNRQKTTDPVDKLFLGGTPPPDAIIQQVNWRDNPWFPKVLYDEMTWLKSRDRDKYLHVWEGAPLSRSEAKVFQNWIEDDLDGQVPSGVQLRYGADWGFSVDPTVLVGMYVWDRTIYIRHEAYKVKCRIEETPSLFAGSDDRAPQKWKNPYKQGGPKHKGLPNARRTRIIADSARPETIAYMKDRGFNIHRAIKGPNSVEEGVEFLQNYDIVVHPSCIHVRDELASYEYKTDPLTEEILSELEDKHNHTIDATRYALEDLRRSRGRPVPGVSLPGMGPRLISK